jgi:hypothetical protein
MDQFSDFSDFGDNFDPFASPPPPSLPPPSPPPLPPPLPLSLPTLLPPPLATYPSKEALFEAIQSWAKGQGYAFSTARSKRLGNGRQKVFYACDRREPPPLSSESRLRLTQSRGTGCLFSITALELPSLDWEVKYRPETTYNTHNHPPSQAPAAHPSHRHLPKVAQNLAQDLLSSGNISLFI